MWFLDQKISPTWKLVRKSNSQASTSHLLNRELWQGAGNLFLHSPPGDSDAHSIKFENHCSKVASLLETSPVSRYRAGMDIDLKIMLQAPVPPLTLNSVHF